MSKLGNVLNGIALSSSIIMLAMVVLIFFCDLSILSSLPRQSNLITHATKQILSIASATAVSMGNYTSSGSAVVPMIQRLNVTPPMVLEQEVSLNSSAASTQVQIPQTPAQHPSLKSDEGGETPTNKKNTTVAASSPQNSTESTTQHPIPPPSPLTSPKEANNHTSIYQTMTPTPANFDHKIREFINNKSCKSHFFFTRILPGPLFRKRDMMAVESLFKTNPDACLVIISDVMESPEGQEILKPITEKGYRILTIAPDFPKLLNNTPVSHWYEDLKKGKINPGHVSISQNLSNLLRLVALYKYGGVYVDTDFIILRNFSNLRNTVGIESYDPETGKLHLINNAALIFAEGHPLVRMFLEDFAAKFNGDIWGNQGPHLVTRVIARVESENGGMQRVEGHNFTVLSPMAFYPVNWPNATDLFRKPEGQEETKWVEQQTALINEKSYGLHFWNAMTKHKKISKGSIVSRLYSGHCIICRDF